MRRNVIVGQSGGPTAVINSTLAGVFQTALDRGAQTVYGMLNGIQGLLEDRWVDLRQYIRSNLDIELLKRTPSAFLGSCRYKLPAIGENQALYEKIFALLDRLDIGYFFYIGGNDSMDSVKKLCDYATLYGSDIRFIGIPKTIDNDLAITDHSPGSGSAAKYIGSITKEIIRDGRVYGEPSVIILEIMGRNTGWLTGAAALARGEDCDGVDQIYLPEKPFEVEAFIDQVDRLQKARRNVVIAVSEGIKLPDGTYVCQQAEDLARQTDAFGHFVLTGTARYLRNRVIGALGCKTRAVELSTLQRCASHIVSRVDITEAYQVGGAAVKAAMEESESGVMMVLKRVSDDPYICVTDACDVHKIANLEKTVPDAWIDTVNHTVTDGMINYIRPLIQAELTPIMTEGLPRHLTIDG
jgi:6-phosphofructokinase 1